MKRLSSSDSLGALMSICPNSTDDQHNQGNNPMYTRDFQTMLDGYDEENCESYQLVGSEKKRRLSVDQVKALEKNFEVENKLVPERKVKLAQDLGLQPRQVAVWFQNRRARWKTKQLERDYGLLKANYDGLKLNFEKLQHDNGALMKEIRELKSKINEDSNNSDSKLSVKDEEFIMSDTEEKSKHETPINSQLEPNSENINSKNGAADIIFAGDFKDGSSDSDSSAILNEDNNNNNSPTGTGGIISINHHHSSSSSNPTGHQFLEIDQNINTNFQFQESNKAIISGKNLLGDSSNNYQFVKIEEHNFFGEESCNTFFSEDQAPSLHWYEWK